MGVVPALLTFGLSIPAGAVVGAGLGASGGAVVGGTAGFIVGGAAGRTVYVNRTEISDGFLTMKAKVDDTIVYIRVRTGEVHNTGKTRVLRTLTVSREKASELTLHARTRTAAVCADAQKRAGVAKTKAQAVVGNQKFQATAASASGGAIVLGTTGGAAGMATGTVIGAACGIPLSLFTFGLSIPIGATVGGGFGLCAGATSGGVAGLAGGGAAGYGAYTNRDKIKSSTNGAWSKANEYAEHAKKTGRESMSYVKDRFTSGTGGTD